jgi:hypothetical protein
MSCISNNLSLKISKGSSIVSIIQHQAGLHNALTMLENLGTTTVNGIIGVSHVAAILTLMQLKQSEISVVMILTSDRNVAKTDSNISKTETSTSSTSSNKTGILLHPVTAHKHPATIITNLDLFKPSCKTSTLLRICSVIVEELMKLPSIYSN